MTRYSSSDEVNAALIELEEHEQKANTEKHSDADKPSSRSVPNAISLNGRSTEHGLEENGEIHEDAGETDSELGSVSSGGHDEDDLDDENHDDGCHSEEDDEEDDDVIGPASDEDEDEVHVRQKIPNIDPIEEASFDQELRALMQESMEQRRLELRGRPTLNMTIPMNVFEGKEHGRGGESGDETGGGGEDESGGGSKEVPVKVLVKRGNKQQTKQMLIPVDCSLVQSTKQKEAAELEEKQDIKRLVLEYNDREEEEMNGLVLGGGSQVTTMHWGSSHGGSGSRVLGSGSAGGGGGGAGGGGRGSSSSSSSPWEGGGRSGGTRFRHHNYPGGGGGGGGGGYYGRRR